jgi:uncharacterized protein (DUF983 family)
MFKNTKLYSILFNKCPRCHTGNFFRGKHPYDFKNFGKMNPHCPVCEEDFERESGYYLGAMYVSYGMNIGLGLGLFLLTVVLLGMDTLAFLFIFLASVLLLFPLIFWFSRLIWINLFVKFDKSLLKKDQYEP